MFNTQQHIILDKVRFEAFKLFCQKQKHFFTWSHAVYVKEYNWYKVYIDFPAKQYYNLRVKEGFPELNTHTGLIIGSYIGMALQRYNKKLAEISGDNSFKIL